MADAIGIASPSISLACIACGISFSFIKSGPGRYPRFCSTECKAERHRLQCASYREPIKHRRICTRCGAEFEASKPNAKQCSAACKVSLKRQRKKARGWKRAPQPIHWAKKNARRRNAVIEDVNPYAVFKRDGWRCQLCGCRTLLKYRGTVDPRAPELDHVLPLSRGGEHSYRNTQLACRSCNAEKSDTPRGQLNLF